MSLEILQSPLTDVVELDHPAWTEFAGFRLPVQFPSGIVAEHLAVRRQAGLFDISHMGRLLIGPATDELLDKLLARRLRGLTDGAIRYSLIADQQGRILDDLMVARLGRDRWQIVCNAGNRPRVVEQLRAAGLGDQLRDITLETAMIALQGPQSAALLARVWPESRAAERRPYRLWRERRGEAELSGSRSGYTGEDGFEIFGPVRELARLWTDLRAAGAVPCGLGSRDSLRNEAALPLYGHELREDTSPWELGLDYAVSLDKDFIGRAELKRRHEAGIRQRRVGLILEGKRIARENMAVVRDGVPLGLVTSGTWSPLLDRPIAQAYVAAAAAEAGGRVEIDVRGRGEPARIVALKELLPR